MAGLSALETAWKNVGFLEYFGGWKCSVQTWWASVHMVLWHKCLRPSVAQISSTTECQEPSKVDWKLHEVWQQNVTPSIESWLLLISKLFSSSRNSSPMWFQNFTFLAVRLQSFHNYLNLPDTNTGFFTLQQFPWFCLSNGPIKKVFFVCLVF